MAKKVMMTSKWENNPAFTLIEIMVAVVIIGILATIALPRLTRKSPTAEWTNVLDEINNLVNYARQEAISNQKTYRLHFQSMRTEQDKIQVELEKGDQSKPGKKVYESVKSFYFNPSYTLPDGISIQAIYHDREEQLEKNKNHAYCYIIPNGLVQETMIHMQRIEKDIEEGKSKKTFKMSPFFGKFELHEGFLKPKK